VYFGINVLNIKREKLNWIYLTTF